MADLTYAFSTGPGILEQQACLLLNSIRANTDTTSDDILIYVVESERDELTTELLSHFEDHATVVNGPMPNPDYPLSATHAALVAASQESPNNYTLLLDTDTIVLDDIDIHTRKSAELFVKPADFGNRYWASSQSQDAWRSLYDKFDFEFPSNRVESTVDHRTMLPYYNSGVILTENNDFPERYLDLSRDIHPVLSENSYFSDMVSLGLLSADYDVEVLEEDYNYPLPHYLTTPKSAKIIHYNESNPLYGSIVIDDDFKMRISDIELPAHFERGYSHFGKLDLMKEIYNIVYFRRQPRAPYPKRLKISTVQALERVGLKDSVKNVLGLIRSIQ